MYFSRRFPNAKIIALTKSFRSTQTILDGSHSMIERTPTTGVPRPRLIAEYTAGGPAIEVSAFGNPQTEAATVAAAAGKLAGENKRVAVLYR